MDPVLGFLIYLIIVMLIAALIVALIERAPFIGADMKPWLKWAVWAVVVILLLRRALPLLAGM